VNASQRCDVFSFFAAATIPRQNWCAPYLSHFEEQLITALHHTGARSFNSAACERKGQIITAEIIIFMDCYAANCDPIVFIKAFRTVNSPC